MSKPRHAEIAGAGLGGLATGIALAQRGWSVRIHERSAQLRMFGAGIWLWENGLRSLDALGVEEMATKRARRIETLVARDQDGRVLMQREFGARDRMMLPPRADLYDALIDRAQELEVDIRTELLNDVSRFAVAHACLRHGSTAARLLAAARVLYDEMGYRVPWVETLADEAADLARTQLDEATFAEAYDQGRTLTLDEALALALTELS